MVYDRGLKMNRIEIDSSYHIPTLASLSGATDYHTHNGYLYANCSKEALDSAKNIYSGPEFSDDEKKRAGVLFEGVMCSAMANDQYGLGTVSGYVKSGLTLKYYFENGNKLTLTPSNIEAFEAVWIPFRQSFFP